jgi:formylglycine-generating enzyme required for sulfatase activity
MKSFDIFISYRHAYTADKAEHLLTLLENNGYRGRVSFDRDNLNSRFDIEILRRIDNCKDFIIVLSEGTFENISFADSDNYVRLSQCPVDQFEALHDELFHESVMDYTRLELARAIYMNKNIVPIAPQKNSRYSFDAMALPQDIRVLTKYQAVFYDDAGSMTFQDVVEKKILEGHSLLISRPNCRIAGFVSGFRAFLTGLIVAVPLLLVYFYLKDHSAYKGCTTVSQCEEYISQKHIFYKRHVCEIKDYLENLLEFKTVSQGLRQSFGQAERGKISVRQAEALSSILANMIFVEGGEFIMGADSLQTDGTVDHDVSIQEMPAHRMSVDDFYIGKYELSVAEWNGIMNLSSDGLSTDEMTMPVTGISWTDIQKFTACLSNLLGVECRLPFESEWEYAAAGGKYSRNFKYSGNNDPAVVAWTDLDSVDSPMPRHRDGIAWWKDSNDLGLFNMSGNVAEFCQDNYRLYSDSDRDYGDNKVVRGGSYDLPARQCRVTARDRAVSTEANGTIGFRLVIKL